MSCITFIILPVPQTVFPLPPLGLAALCFWPCQIFGQSPSCAPFFLFSMSISPIFSYLFRQHLIIQLSQWKDESRASPCTGFWVYEGVGRHGGTLDQKRTARWWNELLWALYRKGLGIHKTISRNISLANIKCCKKKTFHSRK